MDQYWYHINELVLRIFVIVSIDAPAKVLQHINTMPTNIFFILTISPFLSIYYLTLNILTVGKRIIVMKKIYLIYGLRITFIEFSLIATSMAS